MKSVGSCSDDADGSISSASHDVRTAGVNFSLELWTVFGLTLPGLHFLCSMD